MQKNKFRCQIHVPQRTPRLEYVLKFVFDYFLDTEYHIIENQEYVNKITISDSEKNATFFISNYLISRSFELPTFETVNFNGQTFPFGAPNSDSRIPFDIFSTIFFCLTRHEEYFPIQRDEHQRFRSEESWLAKNGWQKIPLVDESVLILKHALEQNFKLEINIKPKFSEHVTLDIDNAYLYHGKQWKRQLGIVREIFNLKKLTFVLSSIFNKNRDVFNTHGLLIEKLSKHKIKKTVFFLCKNGRLDTHIQLSKLRELVKEYEIDGFEIGIHPGYWTETLETEKKILSSFTNQNIVCSRDHFIISRYDITAQNRLNQGLERDFSMGFPDRTGFRAGTCHPFYWFDLKYNQVTNLIIQPFFWMDASYWYYQKTSSEVALKDLFEIKKTCQKYNGTLTYIAHNEILSDYGIFKGWNNLLDEYLEVCS